MVKDNEINKKFGMLTVLDRKRENRRTFYLCKCDCGNEKWIRADSINSGKQKSCGCLKKELFKFKDYSNKKIGKLYITDKYKKEGEYYIWLCKCDCGNEVWLPAHRFRKIDSCGCDRYNKILESQEKAFKAYKDKYIKDNTNLAIITNNKLMKTNKSGVTGVNWDKSREKWVAQMTFKGKNYNLGRFDKKEDAIKARKDAEEKRDEYLRNKGLID